MKHDRRIVLAVAVLGLLASSSLAASAQNKYQQSLSVNHAADSTYAAAKAAGAASSHALPPGQAVVMPADKGGGTMTSGPGESNPGANAGPAMPGVPPSDSSPTNANPQPQASPK